MSEFVDTVGGYFYLMWLSFHATILAPRSMGTLIAPFAPVLAVIAALVLLWMLFSLRKRHRLRKFKLYISGLRGRMMTPEQRTRYLREKLEDGITDKLESYYFLGDITLEEKTMLYREIAKSMGLPGLVNTQKESLKAEIRRRRAMGEDPAVIANRVKIFQQAAEKGREKTEKEMSLIEIICSPKNP